MKRHGGRFLVFLTALLTLTSCHFIFDLLDASSEEQTSTSYTATSYSQLNNNTYVHEIIDNPSSTTNYYKMSHNQYPNTALGASWDVAMLESVGAQKMLVVPIRFTNTNILFGNDTAIENNLNKAFFGASEDTGWESVASYYSKSSFGKLSLSGEVVPTLNLNLTTIELEKKPITNNYLDQTHYLLETVYNTLSASKLKEYDLNNDGHVDSIFLVYLAPYSSESDLFWAYQYYWNRHPNFDKPTFSTYAWASYSFLYEDKSYSQSRAGAHTFIHETGHLLGLDDYYDYDGNNVPLGGLDMMDFNITDHNLYSKFVLNWSFPYVVVGNSNITLGPAESSGDFIILNKNWNGHAYDEYILIEFYTPTGLNEKDSIDGYISTKGFDQSGVRIYHVDSRLKAVYSLGSPRFTDELFPPNNTNYVDYATSNTGSKSYDARYKKIHLLDAAKGETTWYHQQRLSPNSALFQTGDKIHLNEWRDYLFTGNTFNDSQEIGFSVEIGEMNHAGVEIIIRTTP